MSNATQRNFGAAQRERQRRLTSSLEGEMPIGSLAITGDPGWDAFFGSLHDKADQAAAAGMGFRADLGGIGRWAEPNTAGGRLDPNAQNAAYGRLAEEGGARQLALKRAIDAQGDSARDEMRQSYADQVLASVGQPKVEPTVINKTPGQNGNGDAYVVQRDPNAPPDLRSARQQMIDRLPGNLRPQVDAALSPMERADDAQALAERKQTEVERAAKANEELMGASMLSADAVDQNARQYLQTGVMPVLGMKDPGNRQKILNRAAELSASGGGNIAANKADYKADAESLKKLQGQRDAIGAFEETAKKNMDVFLKTAEKIADTGSPLLNQPVRAVSGKVLGSENQAEYDAARAVLLPEIARIITNPNLTGVLSDSARHEVSSFNPETATLGQTIKVMRLLKQDMGNRVGSLDDQIKSIKGRIGGSGPSGGGARNADDYRKKYNY